MQVLEREAIGRAVDGNEKSVFFQWRKITTIRERPDVLLMFLLKGARPEKYRDHYQPPPAASMTAKITIVHEHHR